VAIYIDGIYMERRLSGNNTFGKDRKKQEQAELMDELYKQFSKLKVENDWLK